MVNHDHERVVSMRKGQISDEVDGQLFERQGRRRFDRGEWWGDRVCADLVLLANGTTGDKVVDEDRESWPPKVAFDDGLGAEPS